MNLKGRGLWSIIIRKTDGTVLGSCSITTDSSSLSKTIVAWFELLLLRASDLCTLAVQLLFAARTIT